MDQSPSQPHVDSLAHYLQAVRDLKSSPFFTDGQTSLGVSFSLGADGTQGPMTFKVPDPRVRDSLIVPFRRMWMTGSPANFERVANIIKRFWPQARPYVDHYKDELKKTKSQFPAARFMGLMGSDDIEISPEDVVDLWLNCRLAHVGGKPGKGRFTRADFERELSTYGNAKFEYMFMTAIYHVGLWLINLVQFAELLLKNWADAGHEPSFIFDNITLDGTHKTNTGDSLERHTPGLTIDDNDLETKLELLCRRSPYTEICKLIHMLQTSNSENVLLIQGATGVDGLLSEIGLEVETVDSVDGLSGASQFSTVSDDFTNMKQYPWRKGMIARVGDSKLLMEREAHSILSEQFVQLRTALLGPTT